MTFCRACLYPSSHMPCPNTSETLWSGRRTIRGHTAEDMRPCLCTGRLSCTSAPTEHRSRADRRARRTCGVGPEYTFRLTRGAAGVHGAGAQATGGKEVMPLEGERASARQGQRLNWQNELWATCQKEVSHEHTSSHTRHRHGAVAGECWQQCRSQNQTRALHLCRHLRLLGWKPTSTPTAMAARPACIKG